MLSKAQERKERAKRQRIYLINVPDASSDENVKEFEVVGTTNNIYNVRISPSEVKCTCPDYTTRYNRCKHIYFVLLKIMKLKDGMEDVKKYTEQQIQDMFNNIPAIVDPSIRVSDDIQKKYLESLGSGDIPGSKPQPQRPLTEEDDCPICMDNLLGSTDLVWCKSSCGNSIHSECFKRWCDVSRGSPTCVYCRVAWVGDGAIEKRGLNYKNLDAL
uniref:RING-type domain-containing protein n=1 Tax=viral metagenome TaxID=1070528 RepID=A0A6C0CMI2_9ZZZZ